MKGIPLHTYIMVCMRPHPSSFVLCCISIGPFVPVVCSEAQLYNGSALLHMYTCFSSIILFVTLNFVSSVLVHYTAALLCVCVLSQFHLVSSRKV